MGCVATKEFVVRDNIPGQGLPVLDVAGRGCVYTEFFATYSILLSIKINLCYTRDKLICFGLHSVA